MIRILLYHVTLEAGTVSEKADMEFVVLHRPVRLPDEVGVIPVVVSLTSDHQISTKVVKVSVD